MEFCVGTLNSLFASSVHWRTLFKRYIERVVLTTENRKHEGNNLLFEEEPIKDILLFCVDEIRRRLLSVLMECFLTVWEP